LIVVAFNSKEIRPSSFNNKHFLLDKDLNELIILWHVLQISWKMGWWIRQYDRV